MVMGQSIVSLYACPDYYLLMMLTPRHTSSQRHTASQRVSPSPEADIVVTLLVRTGILQSRSIIPWVVGNESQILV